MRVGRHRHDDGPRPRLHPHRPEPALQRQPRRLVLVLLRVDALEEPHRAQGEDQEAAKVEGAVAAATQRRRAGKVGHGDDGSPLGNGEGEGLLVVDTASGRAAHAAGAACRAAFVHVEQQDLNGELNDFQLILQNDELLA